MAALSSPAPGHRWMAVSGREGLPRTLGWALIPHSSIVGCTVTQDFSSAIHCISRALTNMAACNASGGIPTDTHTHEHINHTELCSDTDWWKNMRGWSSIPHITWTTTRESHFRNVDELLFYTSLIQQNCIDLCLVWLLGWICLAAELERGRGRGVGIRAIMRKVQMNVFYKFLLVIELPSIVLCHKIIWT